MKTTALQTNTVLTSLLPVHVLVLLLFFCNTFLLPHGLSLNFLLAPLFLFSIFQSKRSLRMLCVCMGIVFIFDVIHWMNGVQATSFLKSNLLMTGGIITLVAAYQYFRNNGERMAIHFRQINLFNFFFFLVALVMLFIPVVRTIFWSDISMGHTIGSVARLQLFSPEPSHYALLLSPVLVYYLLSYLVSDQKRNYALALILISIPFLASFSFGNFMVMGLSILLTLLLFSKKLVLRKDNLKIILITLVALIIITAFFAAFLQDHFIHKRISNVLSGTDTSANGRTFQSFGLAWHLAQLKSSWFGIGLGQIKELATPFYRDFFPYITTVPDPVRIPNSNAEVLASFGIIGLTLKLGITGLLFFSKRLYNNAYSTMLFIFIFVFQFMGSYLINFTELIIWALIFANPFQKFNR